MPALDTCHDTVVTALQKAGWIVSPRQKRQRIRRRVIYIDIVAQQQEQKRYIEVKCFPQTEVVEDQYAAIGQYLVYRAALNLLRDSSPLYLAVSSTIFERVFDSVLRQVVLENRIKLLIFDDEMEVVEQWIE
ncbi:MAG: element excision factor XisH family protein [Anaerolineae bacterium]